MNAVDPVVPADSWTFKSADVANNFDAHVVAQLPWYPLVTEAVALAVKQFLPENGKVIEIGCSNGNIARAIKSTVDRRNASYIGIDNSAEMFDRINLPGDETNFLFHHIEAEVFPFPAHDVFVSMLTLIFIKPEDRKAILADAWDNLPTGGAMILVERLSQSSPDISPGRAIGADCRLVWGAGARCARRHGRLSSAS
jgi:tRNA (cmo5U34)-methyltransferase